MSFAKNDFDDYLTDVLMLKNLVGAGIKTLIEELQDEKKTT